MSAGMTPARWALVQQRFNDVLTLPLGERPARLAELEREDQALAAEVRSLLAAHDEGPLGDPSPVLPEFVGPYRLIRPIGEGGMGTVHLAEREGAGFRQRVALKLVRAGFLDPRLGERFADERRILARLEHPGIARLIDAGTTPGGQPYLAMEYVEGHTLLAHADRERFTVEQRLRLFLEVCDAVHYAHQELVVHRDLKPGNILVGMDGRPRLLDFGIAKLVGQSEGGEGATRTLPWMTPAYASPEQVRGGRVGIPTDVYALGVLLYELLADERPYLLVGATPAEIERVVCDAPVPKPSERAADPRRARRLRGDLDVIVLTAMAKDPGRRYRSVEALAEDLRRHLAGRPVLARPDSLAYRAGKFATRHRTGVVLGLLAVLSLAAGLVATAWQARRATREAAAATAEARKAERVSGLLVDLFRLSDPGQALGDTITARQMLDRGTARIEREFGDEPEVQATLFGEVARVYANLGLLPRAEELVRRALALREGLEGPGGAGVAASAGQLGDVLATAGRREEAIASFRRAVAVREARVTGPDSALAAHRAALAWQLRAAGEGEEAAALFGRALADQRALFGAGWPPGAATLLGLASTLHDRGRFDAAEALYQQALAETDTTRPHPAAADALLQVGMIRRLKEEYRQAEPLIRTGRAMRHAIYEEDHPERIAADLELGLVLHELGRFAEAEALIRSAMHRSRGALGGLHPTTISATEALAVVLTTTGRYREAAAWYDSSLGAKRRVHGGDHPQVVFGLLRSGESRLLGGDLEAAEGRLAEAEAMGGRVSGPRSVSRMLVLQARAEMALRRGRMGEAARLLDTAQALGGELLRPGHRYLLALSLDRAALRVREGQPAAARESLGPVLAAYRKLLPSPHPKTGAALVRVAEAELALGNRDAAAEAARAALAEMAALPPAHPRVVETRRLLAQATNAP